MNLRGKKILLGVGGGIAAYKAAGLVRELGREGAEVRVVMTRSAQEFITPLTLQVLSGNPVGVDLFDAGYEHEIGHIEMARWPDLVLVAPATANLLARMRQGMADDLLTTIVLATTAPVMVCPAMNTQMLNHPATQENIDVLEARDGVWVVPSDSGELACKEVGAGRLPDAPVVAAWVRRALNPKPLEGLHVVVSAGPTREHFDPVRFLSNPSSGKMGFAVAAAAWEHGADVTLIHGPVALQPPIGVRARSIVSASDLARELDATTADILVMSAAVADWTPSRVEPHKRKKGEGEWEPRFERTRDILATLGVNSPRPKLVIGFAAETQDVEQYGREKLLRKRLDGVVANNVGGGNGAFNNDENEVYLISETETQQHGPAPKLEVARSIASWIASLWTP